MNHIVDTRPLTKFKGGLNLLHEADDDAVIWLESTATAALAKMNRKICSVAAVSYQLNYYQCVDLDGTCERGLVQGCKQH